MQTCLSMHLRLGCADITVNAGHFDAHSTSSFFRLLGCLTSYLSVYVSVTGLPARQPLCMGVVMRWPWSDMLFSLMRWKVTWLVHAVCHQQGHFCTQRLVILGCWMTNKDINQCHLNTLLATITSGLQTAQHSTAASVLLQTASNWHCSTLRLEILHKSKGMQFLNVNYDLSLPFAGLATTVTWHPWRAVLLISSAEQHREFALACSVLSQKSIPIFVPWLVSLIVNPGGHLM